MSNKIWEEKIAMAVGETNFRKESLLKLLDSKIFPLINQTIKEEIQTAFDKCLSIQMLDDCDGEEFCGICKEFDMTRKQTKQNLKFYLKRYEK